jgi:transposase
MFARIKKSGKNQYLQIVESKREGNKVKQRVLTTLGRLDKIQKKGDIEILIRSLSRFSEKQMIILSQKRDVTVNAKTIGPVLIFERLWKETGIQEAIRTLITERRFEFNIERALFITTLHRLLICGSDRYCDKWKDNYNINASEEISLHHLYRAMGFLGEIIKEGNTFTQRRMKDSIEEGIFSLRRDLFSAAEMVFFDTTSIYFEGEGGETLGERGYSKDHRPDLRQMVAGVIIDSQGRPLCCEMWPGNTADVTTLIPIIEMVKKRFQITDFCIVADRGMISTKTLDYFQQPNVSVKYILGVRMRKMNEVKNEVLNDTNEYEEVYGEKERRAPLKVKEVLHNGKRYIVCLNPKQAKKDAADREAILASLREQIHRGQKQMIGNKGYRKYLTVEPESFSIDMDKVKEDERFDGKWVLTTNTTLNAKEIALKYKELWQVEHIFRSMKSILETRPIYHQRDDTIMGHVFCSFLALVMLKELEKRIEAKGYEFEWKRMKEDLKAMKEVILEEGGKRIVFRTECIGDAGKIFQSVGVAIPPTLRFANE